MLDAVNSVLARDAQQRRVADQSSADLRQRLPR